MMVKTKLFEKTEKLMKGEKVKRRKLSEEPKKKVEKVTNKKTKENYYEEHHRKVNELKTNKERKEYIKDIDFSKKIEKDSDAKIIKELQVYAITPFESEMSETPQRIRDLLDKRKLWDKIVLDELNKKHIGDIPAKEVLFLCSIGRLVKNKKPFSFNCLVLSPSSAGKDHLVASVLKLFPSDEIEIFGRISAKALNYLHTIDEEPNYNYNGRIIYLKEIEETILNNEVMKEFTSGEEEISKVAITKQKGAGVDVKQIRGHPEVFTTTATTIPTEEIRNRFNIIGLDLSDEQTELSFMEEEGIYGEGIIKFLADLKPLKVDIPKKLFNFIKKNFQKNKIRYRRDFYKFLDFVKVLALFHGRNIAEPEDYDRAKDIFMNAFSTCADIPLKDLDNRIVKILERVNQPISARDIFNEMGGIISLVALYPRLRNLVAKEILEELTDRTPIKDGIGGYVVQNYILSEEYTDKKPFKLPNYE